MARPTKVTISSPSGSVNKTFSANGTAESANGLLVTGLVWDQDLDQSSLSINNVPVASNAWSGLNFSLPTNFADAAILKVWISGGGQPASDERAITISSS